MFVCVGLSLIRQSVIYLINLVSDRVVNSELTKPRILTFGHHFFYSIEQDLKDDCVRQEVVMAALTLADC